MDCRKIKPSRYSCIFHQVYLCATVLKCSLTMEVLMRAGECIQGWCPFISASFSWAVSHFCVFGFKSMHTRVLFKLIWDQIQLFNHAALSFFPNIIGLNGSNQCDNKISHFARIVTLGKNLFTLLQLHLFQRLCVGKYDFWASVHNVTVLEIGIDWNSLDCENCLYPLTRALTVTRHIVSQNKIEILPQLYIPSYLQAPFRSHQKCFFS